MKKIIIAISLVAFLLGCKGSMNNMGVPFSIETELTTSKGISVALIDRKITSMVLDVSQKGYAQLNIQLTDELQIGNKKNVIYWTVKIRFDENTSFKIHR